MWMCDQPSSRAYHTILRHFDQTSSRTKVIQRTGKNRYLLLCLSAEKQKRKVCSLCPFSSWLHLHHHYLLITNTNPCRRRRPYVSSVVGHGHPLNHDDTSGRPATNTILRLQSIAVYHPWNHGLQKRAAANQEVEHPPREKCASRRNLAVVPQRRSRVEEVVRVGRMSRLRLPHRMKTLRGGAPDNDANRENHPRRHHHHRRGVVPPSSWGHCMLWISDSAWHVYCMEAWSMSYR